MDVASIGVPDIKTLKVLKSEYRELRFINIWQEFAVTVLSPVNSSCMIQFGQKVSSLIALPHIILPVSLTNSRVLTLDTYV